VRDELLERLDSAERRLAELQAEVEALRALATAEEPPAAPAPLPSPAPPPLVRPAPETGWWQDQRGRWHEGRPASEPEPEAELEVEREPEEAQIAAAWADVPEPEPSVWQREIRLDREIQLDDLVGAKGLAWAGGIVTLLGVVFFFVLAVNRGWIGPGLRVALGAAASSIVFAAGVWVKRRYGGLYAAFSAVGAGIAGGYATLLAATALYDLVPQSVALLVAAGIAAIGLALALAWESETIAGIGLIGAMVVPATLVFQGGLTTIGTAFAAVVFAATAVVAIREDWRVLLGVGLAASLLEIAGLAAYADSVLSWSVIAVAASFWVLYLATGVAWQLYRGAVDRLDRIATSITLLSASFGVLAAVRLFEGSWGHFDREGIAIGAIALVQGAVAAVFWRQSFRELSELHAGLALAVVAIAAADLLSGANLTYVWAAEAALLAWLAPRARERTFQLASFAYLTLATMHALLFEARPTHLFDADVRPGPAIASAAAVGIAALAAAWYARAFDEPREHAGVLARIFDELDRGQRELRTTAGALAALAGAYTLALGILALVELGSGSLEYRFELGHVGVSAAWAVVGLGAVLIAVWRGSDTVLVGGAAWLGVTVAKTLVFDGGEISADHRSASFLAVGACVLLAGYLVQLLDERLVDLSVFVAAASVVALGLALSAVTTLVDGHYGRIDLQGLALLGIAGVYGALGAIAFVRHRDLSSVHWGLGLAVAAGAEGVLVGGSWLVLAWAASAALLAWLSLQLDEPRLLTASGAYLVLSVVFTLARQAPPSHLVQANSHPGHGLASVAFVAAAAAVFARFCTEGAYMPEGTAPAGYGILARALDERRPFWRKYAAWGGGVLAVYGLSLGILELYERIAPGSVTTNFQRGHTNVSALWGVLGLALLYVGLRRDVRALRLGGFALFAVSLAKIFVYDLPNLSAVTRALSFLAVGAVLLAGAFFYQRLKNQLTDRAA
jgi:uncharacterized membrane protein